MVIDFHYCPTLEVYSDHGYPGLFSKLCYCFWYCLILQCEADMGFETYMQTMGKWMTCLWSIMPTQSRNPTAYLLRFSLLWSSNKALNLITLALIFHTFSFMSIHWAVIPRNPIFIMSADHSSPVIEIFSGTVYSGHKWWVFNFSGWLTTIFSSCFMCHKPVVKVYFHIIGCWKVKYGWLWSHWDEGVMEYCVICKCEGLRAVMVHRYIMNFIDRDIHWQLTWLLVAMSVATCYGCVSGWVGLGWVMRKQVGMVLEAGRDADKDLASTSKLRPRCTWCPYLESWVRQKKRRKPKLIFRLELQVDTSRYIY